MRNLTGFLIVVFVTLGSNAVFAKCMSGSMSSFPTAGESIPENAAVVIVAYGSNRAELAHTVKLDNTYFVSKNHKVKATFGELLESKYRKSAVVAIASELLRVDETYKLIAANTRFEWNVVPSDQKNPSWKTHPTLKSFEHVKLGCGPAINFKVDVDVVDRSVVYYDVVLSTPTGRQHFYVRPRGRELSIGHGMCSGAFVVSETGENTVTIVPVDAAGNRGPTRPLKLVAK